MKKTILLAMAVAAGATGTAMAANPVLDNPENRPYVGVRLSAESSIPGTLSFGNTKENVFDAGAGISAGIIYNQPIVANFTVEPGLELYYNTTKFNINDDMMQDMHWKARSTRSFGMRIPVMLGYHFDFSKNFGLNVATGPVLKVGFSDDYYLTSETRIDDAGEAYRFHESGSMYNDNEYTGAGEVNAFNRVDCAWRISIGANFLKHYYAGISGDLGMVNQIKHSNNGAYSMKNNLFQFTLGYNF
ncbi:outer membrane beta-barrel protein [bacterium]|nr:outer membrane beta-barrel protein [Bacteroidales bacterium]MBD5291720.1 outer membrane beta-barrel protein [Bacteroides sp.]MBD5338054.1 outer membrane beta-barrel protein [Bacteroides sp.]MBD5385008.1 outer membrane beta-barrel protein [bacterium]